MAIFKTITKPTPNKYALSSFLIDITVNEEGKFGVEARIQSQDKYSRQTTNRPLYGSPAIYPNAKVATIAGEKVYRAWFKKQEDDLPF